MRLDVLFIAFVSEMLPEPGVELATFFKVKLSSCHPNEIQPLAQSLFSWLKMLFLHASKTNCALLRFRGYQSTGRVNRGASENGTRTHICCMSRRMLYTCGTWGKFHEDLPSLSYSFFVMPSLLLFFVIFAKEMAEDNDGSAIFWVRYKGINLLPVGRR